MSAQVSASVGCRTVTYSPAYTLVPTYECFNRCAYCNFRRDPGKDAWLTIQAAEEALRSLQHQGSEIGGQGAGIGMIEILILSGEVHPQSTRRAAWFEHIYALCELALSLGFLPHTNVGPLSFQEMQRLKAVNVSMGLMLEQITPMLLDTVHRFAPSKVPELRLQQLVWAGELQIPFTTGLLVGIGETAADRLETLNAIAQIHQQWGHIQEVIIQPYSPGQEEAWHHKECSPEELIEVLAIARQVLPEDITLQVPPNLVQNSIHLLACLDAGARDLGGIGPRDEVNPDYPHPVEAELASILQTAGWQLAPRLPIYPQYDRWLAEPLRNRVMEWRLRIQPAYSMS